MAAYDDRQLASTRQDLVFIVQFLAAATFVDEPALFTEFLTWLQELLVHRGVPPQGLVAGLEALRPLVDELDPRASLLLDSGRQLLLSESGPLS